MNKYKILQEESIYIKNINNIVNTYINMLNKTKKSYNNNNYIEILGTKKCNKNFGICLEYIRNTKRVISVKIIQPRKGSIKYKITKNRHIMETIFMPVKKDILPLLDFTIDRIRFYIDGNKIDEIVI